MTFNEGGISLNAPKFFAVFCLAGLLSATNAYSAKQQPKIDVGAQNEESVGLMRQQLVQCQSTYSHELEMVNIEIDRKVLNAKRESQYANLSLERIRAEGEVLNSKRATGFDYKKCIDAAKAETNKSLKPYVALFKKDPVKSFAKQVVSQWFVAIDAVGEQHFNVELSKFDKAANDMKVELAIN